MVDEDEAYDGPADKDIKDLSQTELLSRAAMVVDATSDAEEDGPALPAFAFDDVRRNFCKCSCSCSISFATLKST